MSWIPTHKVNCCGCRRLILHVVKEWPRYTHTNTHCYINDHFQSLTELAIELAVSCLLHLVQSCASFESIQNCFCHWTSSNYIFSCPSLLAPTTSAVLHSDKRAQTTRLTASSLRPHISFWVGCFSFTLTIISNILLSFHYFQFYLTLPPAQQ